MESILTNLECGTRPQQPRFRRTGGRPFKSLAQDFFDRLQLQGGFEQTCRPVRENRCDLVGIFFCDEIVDSGFRLEKYRVERHLGAIVGLQVELIIGRKSISRIERAKGRKSQTSQARGN